MSRPGPSANPDRVRRVQQLRRSSAAGAHSAAVPRGEQLRAALADFEDDDEDAGQPPRR